MLMCAMNKKEVWELRKFGLLMTTVSAIFCGITYLRDHPTAATVFGAIGASFIVMQLVLPLMKGTRFVWMKFAHGLGWFNSRVILTIVFFLVITPIGLVMRLIGKRPLDLAFRDGKPSAWKECQHVDHDYSKMF